MRKLKVYQNFLSERVYVLSPAKTGSTYVASVTRTTGHGHSFFMERPFFYKDVKFESLIITINRISFFLLALLKSAFNRVTGKTSVILIPLRTETKRRESLLKDLLIPLASRYYFSSEYRRIHHEEKAVVLNYYRTKLNDRGLSLWCKSHGFPLREIENISEKRMANPYVNTRGTIKIIAFNIEDFNSEGIRSLLAKHGVRVEESGQSNKTEALWYAELFS